MGKLNGMVHPPVTTDEYVAARARSGGRARRHRRRSSRAHESTAADGDGDRIVRLECREGAAHGDTVCQARPA
jgi:hypothetical protein